MKPFKNWVDMAFAALRHAIHRDTKQTEISEFSRSIFHLSYCRAYGKTRTAPNKSMALCSKEIFNAIPTFFHQDQIEVYPHWGDTHYDHHFYRNVVIVPNDKLCNTGGKHGFHAIYWMTIAEGTKGFGLKWLYEEVKEITELSPLFNIEASIFIPKRDGRLIIRN